MMIRFGDNDFRDTFVHTLEVFRNLLISYPTRSEIWHDKLCVVKILNEITPAHQRAIDIIRGSKITEHSAEYVKVNQNDILIGQEVYDFLVSRNYDGNLSWFVLDMNLPESQQISVY